MFKFVIWLTILVFCTNGLGVIPPEITGALGELTARATPSTSEYYRLPKDTIPVRYDVSVTTDIHKGVFDFSGNVQIYLQAVTYANQIVIHQRQLTIDEMTSSLKGVELLDNGEFRDLNNVILLKAFEYNATTEFLIIPLESGTLQINQYYRLEIDYTGTLRGSKAGGGQRDVGFYRSSYKNANNEDQWLAATKFEPHDARHAFPCYDEPALKAKFNIQIKHGSIYNAVSNMPEKSVEEQGQYKITTFMESPLMSTYLVAFVVSDFKYVANLEEPVTDNEKVLHRVFGTPLRQDQLNYTLETGVKMLDALSDYLNVKYIETMPKMDQIAPPDFASGAMENWGLVAYAESYFYYSSTSSYTQKDRIAKVVAHEFAHQWFGNLVSPEWWNYLWLNEGFATLFEYLIPNIVDPEYEALDYFTIQICQRMFISDSASDIRPMTFAAYSPTEVSNLFDRIAYDKSGCVITMMMHAIGENAFKAGLNRYLIERRLQEGNSDYLFTALQIEAKTAGTIPSSLTVNRVFNGWATQRGFPILKVNFDITNKTITLEQEAFLLDTLTDDEHLIWIIPYNFVTDDDLSDTDNEDTSTQGWLVEASETIEPSAERNWTNANWVIFNKKLTGYYRVTYNTENWNAIINFVDKEEDALKIHYLNRAQLLGDAMNIARANRLSYDIPLRLARNIMKHEISYFTWAPFINDFNYVEQMIFDTSSHAKLLKLAIDVAPTGYNYYTVSERSTDKYYDVIARYNLIHFLCKVGYTECHEDTTAALISYLDNKLTVSSYLKPAILQNGLRNANNTIFLRVWTSVMTSTTDRSTYVSGLGHTNFEENIQHLLGSLLTATNQLYAGVTVNYDSTDRNTILTTIATSKVSGFRRVFQFLKTEAVTIKSIWNTTITSVFSTLAGRTSTEETLSELKDLMNLYEENDVNNRFPGYIRTAEENIAWNKVAGSTIKAAVDSIYREDDDDDGASSMVVSTILVTVSIMVSRFLL